jgi:hypothetical protein
VDLPRPHIHIQPIPGRDQHQRTGHDRHHPHLRVRHHLLPVAGSRVHVQEHIPAVRVRIVFWQEHGSELALGLGLGGGDLQPGPGGGQPLPGQVPHIHLLFECAAGGVPVCGCAGSELAGPVGVVIANSLLARGRGETAAGPGIAGTGRR